MNGNINGNINESIVEWLKAFDYDSTLSEQSCIILTGNSGVGKTYSIQSIAKELDLFVINIDNHNCYNSQQLRDMIFKSVTSSLIQTLSNTISKNKIIIIDNFDSMFMSDKTINNGLLKILAERMLKNIPIVCIVNSDVLKKMGDIKKICRIFELSERKQKVLEADSNIDVLHLYNNKFHREKMRKIVESDVWLIPLRFHENLVLELNNRKITYNKKKYYYKQFIDILCAYDYYMCNNHIDIAVELFVCAIYGLSLLVGKKMNESKMDNFTKILSYLSLQKKYIKQYYNTEFPLYQIGNYHTHLLSRKFVYFN